MIIDSIPLWALFFGTVVISLLSIEFGFRVGRRRAGSGMHEAEAPLGALIASTLGLLAFMLAFTFNLAANRFDDRRVAVLTEANAIGTAYLRADFLEPAHRDNVKRLFREYAALRTQRERPINQVLAESQRLQQALWAESIASFSKLSDSEVYALYIQSLNEVIDVHAVRVVAGRYARVPVVVWSALLFVAILSLVGVGYVSGLGKVRSYLPSLIMAVSFSSILCLVADLDRPMEGTITTNLKPLNDLQQSIILKDEGNGAIKR